MSLFHYTDVHAVHSILLNKKLWLTNIQFLNDSQELREGIRYLINALECPPLELFENFNYRGKAIEYLGSALGDTVDCGVDSESIFVFSLSRTGDLLSQWRAYGSYAIEFDERRLMDFFSTLHPCVYDSKLKVDKSTAAVMDAIKKISQDMGCSHGCTSSVSGDSLEVLVKLAATFKDGGFSEEQEVRVIAGLSENSDLIKYRPKGDILIPYLEVAIPMDCVKAIHVGPMGSQSLACNSMSSFTHDVERSWQMDSLNIEYWLQVKRSSIPYRG